MWYIIGGLILVIGGYYLGCKFPPTSIKRKIVQDAQDAINKIKNA